MNIISVHHTPLILTLSYSLTHPLTHLLSFLQYSSSCRLLKQNFSNFAKDKVFCFFFFFSFVINNLKTILHDFCVRQANINKAPEIIKEKMKKHFPIFFLYIKLYKIIDSPAYENKRTKVCYSTSNNDRYLKHKMRVYWRSKINMK